MQSGTTPDGLVLTGPRTGQFASVGFDKTFKLAGDLMLGEGGVVLRTEAGELAVYFGGRRIGSVGAAPVPAPAPAPEPVAQCSLQLTGYTQLDNHVRGTTFQAGETAFADSAFAWRGKSRLASGSLSFYVQCEEEVRMVLAYSRNNSWTEIGDEFRSSQPNVLVSSPVVTLPRDSAPVTLGVRIRSDGKKMVKVGPMSLHASQ
jgi:hypothetical protein